MYLVKETSPDGFINYRLLYDFQITALTGKPVVLGKSYQAASGEYVILEEVNT